MTALKVLLAVFIAIFIISAFFNLFGSLLHFVFGFLSSVLHFVFDFTGGFFSVAWRIIMNPFVLIGVIIVLLFKLKKQK